MICPLHRYVLGQCPSCDGDPEPIVRHLDGLLDRGIALDPVEMAVLTYQKRRLAAIQAGRSRRGQVLGLFRREEQR